MKIPTNSPLDSILNGGIEDDTITNIYGPAGSGKTNITLSTAVGFSGKIVYIDTEGSFSFERFSQLGGNEKQLKNIILIDIHSWSEQHEKIKSLEKFVEKNYIGLIIIDSLVAFYRLEITNENYQLVNKQLVTQYSILSKIARKQKIPVLVTNQVYGYTDHGIEKIEMTSRAIAKYWSKALIELKRTEGENRRIAILRKHRSISEGKKISFTITENGFKATGRFGIF